jgi:hypothetical protein
MRKAVQIQVQMAKVQTNLLSFMIFREYFTTSFMELGG